VHRPKRFAITLAECFPAFGVRRGAQSTHQQPVATARTSPDRIFWGLFHPPSTALRQRVDERGKRQPPARAFKTSEAIVASSQMKPPEPKLSPAKVFGRGRSNTDLDGRGRVHDARCFANSSATVRPSRSVWVIARRAGVSWYLDIAREGLCLCRIRGTDAKIQGKLFP